MPDGRVLKTLDLSASEVAEMTESEYRNTMLRHDKPLTPPVIKAIERSVGRERERLEDFYEPHSGAEKWVEMGGEILPRWAEVASELDRRTDYAHSNGIETEYRKALSGGLRRATGLKERLTSNPVDRDLVEFVKCYRELENTYERELE